MLLWSVSVTRPCNPADASATTQRFFYSWCWAPAPFYTYLTENGFGWARVAEQHPGLFNLMWAAAGGPAKYIARATDRPVCLGLQCEAQFIPIKRPPVPVRLARSDHCGVGAKKPPAPFYSLADAAFELPLPKFIKAYESSALARTWKFRSVGCSHEDMLRRFKNALETQRSA